MEFTKRGQVHFHIYSTEYIPKDWLCPAWAEVAQTGDLNHAIVSTRSEGIRAGRRGFLSYAIKYAKKHSQKAIPEHFKNAGRFWGIIGERGVSAVTDVHDPRKDWANKAKIERLNRLSAVINSVKTNEKTETRVTKWEITDKKMTIYGTSIVIRDANIMRKINNLVRIWMEEDAKSRSLQAEPIAA